MPAPKEHIEAGTDAASGTIDVDLMNLANTRGEIKADLLSLNTATFDDPAKDKSQTTHARTWLEVADGEEGKIPEDVKAWHSARVQVDGRGEHSAAGRAPRAQGRALAPENLRRFVLDWTLMIWPRLAGSMRATDELGQVQRVQRRSEVASAPARQRGERVRGIRVVLIAIPPDLSEHRPW